MIAGPNAYICGRCVQECTVIIRESRTTDLKFKGDLDSRRRDHVAGLAVTMLNRLSEATHTHLALTDEAQELCEQRYAAAYDDLAFEGCSPSHLEVCYLRALARAAADKHFGVVLTDDDFARIEGRSI